MKTRILPFTYEPSYRIITWGQTFDSLRELKFAISIMEEYEFIREPVSIYYDPATKIPVQQIRRFHRRYTPDFLIRHRQTGEEFLIEIKPRSIEFHPHLSARQRVAENFIRHENLDWKFKMVFDDQIILTADQLEEFEECFKLNSKLAWKTWFEEYGQRMSAQNPFLQNRGSGIKRIEFLMFGARDRRHQCS
jgi:hypothetical protein